MLIVYYMILQVAKPAKRGVQMITDIQREANACYAKGEYHRDSEGRILNELGRVAKGRDIILRAHNGYPLKRACDLTFIPCAEPGVM